MRQAVILAAGEGRRLRPFTVTKPKVMLSIAGKPVLQYVIESLAHHGIRSIILIVGYRKEQVFNYFGSGERFGVDITYITQESQLGTAHALAQAKEATANEFLVLPGDKLIEPDTIAQFIGINPEALLATRVDNPARFGIVSIENDMVKNIDDRPRQPESNIVNTGIYAFSKEVFDFIEPELDIPDALNGMLNQGKSIIAVETDDAWLDVTYPWDILSLNDVILHRIPAELNGTTETDVSIKGQVSVEKNTVIRSHSYLVGPIVVGEGCDIGPNVCIFPSTSIGDNVVISPFTDIRNSVIGDDVHIGAGAVIQDSVIDKGCIIGGQFTAGSGDTEVKVNHEHYSVKVGAMLGEGCQLDNSVTAQPGVIVGNYSQIRALKLISGRIPDRGLVV